MRTNQQKKQTKYTHIYAKKKKHPILEQLIGMFMSDKCTSDFTPSLFNVKTTLCR